MMDPMVSLLVALVLTGGDGITGEEFRTLHRNLQPAADAPWRTIPWSISLLKAQALAGRERKPIFIWAMDGHPLGCT